MEPAEYLELGRHLIIELLEREHAAPWIEVEARISDSRFPGAPAFVEPHHLSRARVLLEADGTIVQRAEGTRGGRTVTLWTLASARRGQKGVDRAAARKRLLAARYLGWAQGTPSRPGIIGPAAEQVVHESAIHAAPHGFTLIEPAGGGVAKFLGVDVPGGPLDHALVRTQFTDGLPVGFVALPVEVKNMRDWIYPSSRELYQLLDKAAQIQAARPDVRVVPVFICRRAHIMTMRMAKALGFFVVMTRRQYIAPTVDETKVLELRRELGLSDLARHIGADKRITDGLVRHLPKVLDRSADTWAETSELLGSFFGDMRREADGTARSVILRELKKEFRAAWDLDFGLGW